MTKYRIAVYKNGIDQEVFYIQKRFLHFFWRPILTSEDSAHFSFLHRYCIDGAKYELETLITKDKLKKKKVFIKIIEAEDLKTEKNKENNCGD